MAVALSLQRKGACAVGVCAEGVCAAGAVMATVEVETGATERAAVAAAARVEVETSHRCGGESGGGCRPVHWQR